MGGSAVVPLWMVKQPRFARVSRHDKGPEQTEGACLSGCSGPWSANLALQIVLIVAFLNPALMAAVF